MTVNNTRNYPDPDFISVCICTYLRPEMLAKALEAVISQEASSFSLEIIVVDNDKNRSAQEKVHHIQSGTKIPISYTCEQEQNISLARNRAVRNARGNYIAFIDDDEFPVKDWLVKMYRCLLDHQADSVLGPVVPDYPDQIPSWLIKSRFCERRRNATGSVITDKDKRTGNILFKRNLFEKDALWFDPARGLTGGEDSDFISRQMDRGKNFIWCDEAIVYETVVEERWTSSYYLQRSFRSGTISAKIVRRQQALRSVTKATVLIVIYSATLPFTFPAGKPLWMKILTKLSYHAGFLLSFSGLIKARVR